MPSISDILHNTRIKILDLLYNEPKTLGDLSKNINLSKPEISRHLAKLKEQNLISKCDNLNEITGLGKIILNIISPLEFIFQNYDFFMNHNINYLPLEFIRNFDALIGSEIIEGTGYILKKMEEISKIPTKEIKIISGQPFPDMRDEIVNNAYFIVPLVVKSKNIKFSFSEKYNNYEIRTIPIVRFPLGIIDNKYGFLFFPDLNGNVDYNFALFAENSRSVEFLNQIWEHFWITATAWEKYNL